MTAADTLVNGFNQYIRETARVSGKQFEACMAGLDDLREWAVEEGNAKQVTLMETVIDTIHVRRQRLKQLEPPLK
jgi:hypothetical protein